MRTSRFGLLGNFILCATLSAAVAAPAQAGWQLVLDQATSTAKIDDVNLFSFVLTSASPNHTYFAGYAMGIFLGLGTSSAVSPGPRGYWRREYAWTPEPGAPNGEAAAGGTAELSYHFTSSSSPSALSCTTIIHLTSSLASFGPFIVPLNVTNAGTGVTTVGGISVPGGGGTLAGANVETRTYPFQYACCDAFWIQQNTRVFGAVSAGGGVATGGNMDSTSLGALFGAPVELRGCGREGQ